MPDNRDLLVEISDDYVLSLLPDYTLRAMNNANSAQALAFEFLSADPNPTFYPDWRIKQRFALATLYFATGGPTTWTQRSGWLDYNTHECLWWSQPTSYDPDLVNQNPYTPHWDCWDCICPQHLPEPFNTAYPNPCEEEELEDIQEGVYKNLWLWKNDLDGSLPPELFWGLPSLRSLNFDPVNNDTKDYDSFLGRFSEVNWIV